MNLWWSLWMVRAMPGHGSEIHKAPEVSLPLSTFPWRERKKEGENT